MKKLLNLLAVWMFGSVRADKKRSPQGSEGGSFAEAKLVKRSEAPKRGEFNIMLGYGNKNVLSKKEEREKEINSALDRALLASTILMLWSSMMPEGESKLSILVLCFLIWYTICETAQGIILCFRN